MLIFISVKYIFQNFSISLVFELTYEKLVRFISLVRRQSDMYSDEDDPQTSVVIDHTTDTCWFVICADLIIIHVL